jgi:hypothetical protein
VKRATGLVVLAGFFKLNATINDIDDIAAGDQVINKVSGDPACHSALLF